MNVLFLLFPPPAWTIPEVSLFFCNRRWATGNILTASILPLDTAHISKSVSAGRMEVRLHSADRYRAVTPPLIKRRHSDSFSEVWPPCSGGSCWGGNQTRTSGADPTQKTVGGKKGAVWPSLPQGVTRLYEVAAVTWRAWCLSRAAAINKDSSHLSN